jgi:isopentenyl-diphosphate Delta-isomerase
MKTLKFKPYLVEKILAGTKTTTWRLYDDKDIQVGDSIDVFNKENGDQFGVITVMHVYEKTLGTLDEADWEGHERFPSESAMYDEYREYYGEDVGPETPVKIINFTFEPKRYNKIVVVNEQDEVIGAEYMRIAVEKGLIRRAARVYVFNEAGQLLVQQRSLKVAKPLLLDQSAAGHVDDGETYEEAAKRELQEELGLQGYELHPIVLSFRDRDFFNGIYKIVVPNDTPINFDPEEVARVMWLHPHQIDIEMNHAPEKFTPAFTEVWKRLRNQLVA